MRLTEDIRHKPPLRPRAPLKLAEGTNAISRIESMLLDKQTPLRSYLVALNIEGRKWTA